MYLLPMPKNTVYTEGVLRDGAWALYAESVPMWVAAAYAPLTAEDGMVPLRVTCGEDAESERYRLAVTPEEITVTADGPKGAFYAAQTLRQLRVQGTVPCCEIEDEPALRYRGFYQDVSRGRIPTLETLKVLVDRLSECKMNSLQFTWSTPTALRNTQGFRRSSAFIPTRRSWSLIAIAVSVAWS